MWNGSWRDRCWKEGRKNRDEDAKKRDERKHARITKAELR